MAKRINKKVIGTVKKYLAEVGKDYQIEGAFLFGSYANGTEHAESDIDVAILLAKIENRYKERINLSRYTWNIDSRIEPHPIRTDEYMNNSSILASEIIRNGIRIA